MFCWWESWRFSIVQLTKRKHWSTTFRSSERFFTLIFYSVCSLSRRCFSSASINRRIEWENSFSSFIFREEMFFSFDFQSACRIVGILLDFFLLASFSWLFVDGIELLLTIKHPIKIDRLRLFVYSLYSYGFPLLIVSLSISIFSDYSNENQL